MYYNIETKETAEKLPCKAIIGTQTFASIQPLDLALAAKVGWRKIIEAKPSVDNVVIARSYVQSKVDPLAVAEVLATITKADAALADKQASDLATAAAEARVTERAAWIESIVKAFPDEKQADAIRLLAETVRPW